MLTITRPASPRDAIIDLPTSASQWLLEGCLAESAELTRTIVSKNPFSVGRHPGVDLRIDSRNVSKLHADLVAGGEVLFVRDLDSSNGTFVNGQRITQATPVGDGDLLQFADMEFRLRRQQEAAPEQTMMSNRPEEGWLISRLQQIVNKRQVTMAFQPIVSAITREAIGYEALVRCKLPGLESPLKLFEAAERMHLEGRISTICREEAAQSLGQKHLSRRLFVNTHPHEHLGTELLDSLRRLQTLSPGRQLVLEIHEAAVPDLATMRSFRDGLNELGILLAYDDFGAGQSRLLELTEVPPDYLKFDRSLVKILPEASAGHRALVQTLVNLANDYGITTIAEGLDSEAMVDACCELGFTQLQGFQLARPMFAADLA